MLLWPDLAAQWPGLPAGTRRELVAVAARGLHQAWQAGGDLRALPVSALGFALLDGVATEARLPHGLVPELPRPLNPPQWRGVLAGWFNEVRPILRPAEALRFLRLLLPDLADDQLHYQARAIRCLADNRMSTRAAALYQEALGDTRISAGDCLAGRWKLDARIRPADLLEALSSSESDPMARPIKCGPAITVTRACLWGEDVIIKRYRLAGGWKSWTYRGRASRARRAWAAGQTMAALGIPTPEPLGFLEVRQGRIPTTSYIITRFATQAESAFRWVQRSYRNLGDEDRLRARNELRRLLRQLYASGLYHGDTKLTNLLIVPGQDGSPRTWLWTDLECVDAGLALTRRRLLRNLVQLNGSLRHWVPEADRLAFLQALAWDRPWLARPQVAKLIRRRSQHRLHRELTGRTPPDGRPAS